MFSCLHLATSSDRLLMFTFLSACKISSSSRIQRGQRLVALEYAGVWAQTDQLMLYPAFLRFMSQIMSFDNSVLFSIRSCLIHVMCPSYRFLNFISVQARYSFRSSFPVSVTLALYTIDWIWQFPCMGQLTLSLQLHLLSVLHLSASSARPNCCAPLVQQTCSACSCNLLLLCYC